MTREEAIQILSTRDWSGMLCGYTSGYTEALDMAIEALQGDMYCPNCGVRLVQEDEYIEPTQTHGRLIDAYALMKELSDIQPCNWTESEAEIQEDADYSLFKSLINSAPTVQADRPHGEWIYHVDDLFPTESTQECSNCNKHQPININDDDFCPACGADMRKGKE